MRPRSLHIEGRRWFRKTYGNTYCTARVYLDGAAPVKLGPTSGYGDFPLQLAVEWLRTNGYPEAEYGTEYLRETLGGTYSVTDVARERDL